MNFNNGRRRSAWGAIWPLFTGGVRGLGQHWMLATFSLVAAFALWFVIQDVENPRVDGFVPPEADAPAIAVQPLNVPSGYVVAEPEPVRVKVEARKDDLPNLTPADFTATIDLKDAPVGVAAQVRVDVTSQRSGVRVIGVTPSTVTVTLQKAAVKQMNVNVRPIGQLPPNYVETGQPPVVDPATVTVTGLPNLVNSVDTVDVDIDLRNVQSNAPIEGPLVARTTTGTPVTVTLSQTRAKVSFSVTQAFEQRTLSPSPNVSGQPAPGYHITNVLVDPPTVTVTGPAKDVSGLPQLPIERIDISGATTDVNALRKVIVPQNVSIDHQSVNVTVVIKPIDCGVDQAQSPCGGATFVVAPDISQPPSGLALDPSTRISVTVQVYGPLNQLNSLKVSDIRASISLASGKAGTNSYPVDVTLPSGLSSAAILPVSITLVASP